MNVMQVSEIGPLPLSPIPHPRSGHRAVATDSDLWIFGGFHPSARNNSPHMFNELWRFNFAMRQWKLEQTTGDGPRVTLASHAMCRDGQYVFVFGGTGFPFGESISNILYILDLKRLIWRRCRLHHDPLQEVYGASMVQKDEHLYILCGTNRTMYSMSVYQIHLPTWTCTLLGDAWNQMDWLDDGRYRQEVHLYEDQIFVFGGGGMFATTCPLDKIPVFNLTTHLWSFVNTNPDPVHNYPHSRKFHSIFPFGEHQILMFGGAYYHPPLHEHVPVDEHIWILDMKKFEWSLHSSLTLIRPMYFQAAAMNEREEIWTHGGIINTFDDDDHPTRITNIYRLPLRLSKLSEIVWNQFLTHLSDRRCLINQPTLVNQLNIPLQFVRRLR